MALSPFVAGCTGRLKAEGKKSLFPDKSSVSHPDQMTSVGRLSFLSFFSLSFPFFFDTWCWGSQIVCFHNFLGGMGTVGLETAFLTKPSSFQRLCEHSAESVFKHPRD